MCHRTTCRACGKATWSGCGNHIEQALAGVPRDQRCTCDSTSSASGGLLSRLLGR
jgi:hypothetical protein